MTQMTLDKKEKSVSISTLSELKNEKLIYQKS
jgi:hypothetical protein